jgi:hypothetical protein
MSTKFCKSLVNIFIKRYELTGFAIKFSAELIESLLVLILIDYYLLGII